MSEREKDREEIKGALKQFDPERDLWPVSPLSPPAVCDNTIQNFSSSDGRDKKRNTYLCAHARTRTHTHTHNTSAEPLLPFFLTDGIIFII